MALKSALATCEAHIKVYTSPKFRHIIEVRFPETTDVALVLLYLANLSFSSLFLPIL